jgi:hypothetical protein
MKIQASRNIERTQRDIIQAETSARRECGYAIELPASSWEASCLAAVPSAGLPLNRAAMMGMVLETSELILVNIAEDSLKIEGAED